MNTFASMGFLAGGVELGAVRDAAVKAYLAKGGSSGGADSSNNDEEILRRVVDLDGHDAYGYPHVLISFVYDQESNFFEEKLRYWPRSCLGDSGAFTVWTKGETVDLDEYATWCLGYLVKRPDFQFLNLDVIPGDPMTTRRPTVKEREHAMAASLENADRLRAAGVPIIEVYHLHEPLDYFDRLIERREPGQPIALGGLAGRGTPTPTRHLFCRQTFRHVHQVCGGWDNLIPLHGLGISPTIKLAMEFPWFSVDASSWAVPARYGKHVSRAGKISMSGEGDSRVSKRSVRKLYLTRVLEGWQKRENELTEMWAGRGIRFAE